MRIRGRVHNLGIGRIDRHIGEPGIVIDELGPLPGLAAVYGLIQAAIRIGAEQVSPRRNIDDVGVGGVHHQALDGLRFFQSQMRPVRAAIRRAPDAIADRRALPVVALAHAHVDDVLVRRRYGDRTDRFVWHIVEQRVPVVPAVGGLPQAARGKPDVNGHRILLGSLDVVHAAHHGSRPDGAELETLEQGIGRNIRRRTGGLPASASLSPCHACSAQANGSNHQYRRPATAQNGCAHTCDPP